jgi:hypothetical protein
MMTARPGVHLEKARDMAIQSQSEFLAQFLKSNSERGREMVLGPLREGRPIDAQAIIDLLNWSNCATGEVTNPIIDGQGSIFTAPMKASNEPRLRLTSAIWTLCELLNSGLKKK